MLAIVRRSRRPEDPENILIERLRQDASFRDTGCCRTPLFFRYLPAPEGRREY